MFVSPKSLKEICFQFLRKQIKTENLYINCLICGHLLEQLLEQISEELELTDEILLSPIFDPKVSQLRNVNLSDAQMVSSSGLRVLRSHRIVGLKVNNLQKCSINELIGCLGEYSLQKMTSLSVARSSFTASNKFCVVVGLAKLQSLRALDVSNTDFNVHALEIVCEDLPEIQSLNISNTRVKDISALRKCRQRLKSLQMFNLKSNSGGNEDFLSILLELNNLVLLDISDDRDHPLDVFLRKVHDCTPQLLKHWHCFPFLKSLDISGREIVDKQLLEQFLSHKKDMQFLGLLKCPVAFDFVDINQWYDSDIQISGIASENQLKESLRRYKMRSTFIQKSLFHLYNYTASYSEPRIDLIELIMSAMRVQIQSIAICMAATACLYNLTKNSDNIHPKTLKSVVDVTLLAMETHPNHQQLQKNALLTLCKDRILQNVSFDRFRCCQLVLDSLVQFKDTAMNRMAVAITSILSAKISTDETSILGSKPVYMSSLLEIVRQREDNDVMLKFTLSALWNLTDESPKPCEMFLKKGGLDLYLTVLREFSGESAFETKVLGLLNNIAEVSHLRPFLLNHDFLQVLRNLMKSNEINVSYFAAGIFAHLCCHSSSEVDFSFILEELVSVVLNWKTPDVEMVAYRSFVPFLPLLNCFESPAVQFWAIWAIHDVCSKNPKRYCEMLVNENGLKTIKTIIDSSDENNHLRQYCLKTLEVVKQEFPNIC